MRGSKEGVGEEEEEEGGVGALLEYVVVAVSDRRCSSEAGRRLAR